MRNKNQCIFCSVVTRKNVLFKIQKYAINISILNEKVK